MKGGNFFLLKDVSFSLSNSGKFANFQFVAHHKKFSECDLHINKKKFVLETISRDCEST
jgi:hypothetical protein